MRNRPGDRVILIHSIQNISPLRTRRTQRKDKKFMPLCFLHALCVLFGEISPLSSPLAGPKKPTRREKPAARQRVLESSGSKPRGRPGPYRAGKRYISWPTYPSSATLNKELTAANSVSNRLKVSLSTAFGGFDAKKFATA
jgi:hypothetical protein